MKITHVAAICFRKEKEIEYLLVLTNEGRWTFPKGHIEPDMTESETAKLEAYEEAGVVSGEIESRSFITYEHRKLSGTVNNINAYLYKVNETEPPQETFRNPTWFSLEKAKEALAEGRIEPYLSEAIKVLNESCAKIK